MSDSTLTALAGPARQSPISGVWPALLTPLDARLGIDIARFAAHAQALLGAGCSGVTPFGTTGEGPSFSVAERQAAIDGLVDAGVPAAQILVSTSCAALPDAVALTRHAVQVGARGVLLLPPFFLKGVPDAGIVDFYAQLIAQVDDPRLRIMLYNIPQVSGVALSPALIQTLLQRFPQTLIGLKDSGCQRDISLGYADALMPPLQVWVGNEPDLQTLADRGSLGAVSGVANLAPRLVARLVQGARASDPAADQARMLALLAVLLRGPWGLTAAFKGLLAWRSGHAGWRRVRAPLLALRDDEYGKLVALWQALGIDPARD